MQKKAFTLIELLIVVIIIGVVYTLALNKLHQVSDPSQKLSLQTLKLFLSSLEFQKEVKVRCFDDCSSCSVYVDTKVDKALSKKFDDFIDDTIKVYRYEYLSGMQEITPEVFFNTQGMQESICFSYGIDTKGIGDQVIVEYKDKVYDFTPFTKEPKVYEQLDDVITSKEKEYQEVLR